MYDIKLKWSQGNCYLEANRIIQEKLNRNRFNNSRQILCLELC